MMPVGYGVTMAEWVDATSKADSSDDEGKHMQPSSRRKAHAVTMDVSRVCVLTIGEDQKAYRCQ
jgi:hypothetical protein